jgi:hypothetical protein
MHLCQKSLGSPNAGEFATDITVGLCEVITNPQPIDWPNPSKIESTITLTLKSFFGDYGLIQFLKCQYVFIPAEFLLNKFLAVTSKFFA